MDKFDINNICIPNELINGKVIDVIKPIDVKTPKWREIKLEPCFDLDSIEDEELIGGDETFVKRHELYELKERYHQLYKKIVCSKDMNEQQIDANDHTKRRRRSTSFSLMTNTININDTLKKSCLEKLKDLVQKLERQHNSKKNSSNTSNNGNVVLLNSNLDDNGKLIYMLIYKNIYVF